MEITLYDYEDKKVRFALPIPFEDVTLAMRLVLSGDEEVILVAKDKTRYVLDSSENRLSSFFDAMEIIPLGEFEKYFSERDGKQSFWKYAWGRYDPKIVYVDGFPEPEGGQQQ